MDKRDKRDKRDKQDKRDKRKHHFKKVDSFYHKFKKNDNVDSPRSPKSKKPKYTEGRGFSLRGAIEISPCPNCKTPSWWLYQQCFFKKDFFTCDHCFDVNHKCNPFACCSKY